MIIKIFLGISIICACTLIGGIKAARLKQKRDFFMGLENFLIYLKREISFSFSDISTVIRSYSSSSEDVRNLLEGFIEGSVAIPKFLSESERLLVLEFFEKIGKSDKVNELELINFFQDEICKLREMENIKCIKMSKIYVKLGFFIGMIVFVVIV